MKNFIILGDATRKGDDIIININNICAIEDAFNSESRTRSMIEVTTGQKYYVTDEMSDILDMIKDCQEEDDTKDELLRDIIDRMETLAEKLGIIADEIAECNSNMQ